jgi:chlorinating enzyme
MTHTRRMRDRMPVPPCDEAPPFTRVFGRDADRINVVAVQDVTLLVKTFLRPRALFRLLDSIERTYPELPVLVADDGDEPIREQVLTRHRQVVDYVVLPFDSGISRGRNALLERVRSRYFVLLDDDVAFGAATRLDVMLRHLRESGCELMGGSVEENGVPLPWELDLEAGTDPETGRYLRLHRVPTRAPYTRCDAVHNFFMAETEAVRRKVGGWDDDLKVLEHTDFFWRAKTGGLAVAHCPEVAVLHDHTLDSERYREFRFGRTASARRCFLRKQGFDALLDWDGNVMARRDGTSKGGAGADVVAGAGRARSTHGMAARRQAQFAAHGFAGPFVAWTPAEMRDVEGHVAADLATVAALRAPRAQLLASRNRHLDSPVMAALCRHPAIVDRLTELLGQELSLWRSQIFAVRRGAGLPWHQDQYNTFIAAGAPHVAVHLAITAATEESCVALLPGSHVQTPAEIHRHFGLRLVEGSAGTGYGTPRYVPETADAASARRMTLRPGEFFLFHPSLLHTSQIGRLGSVGAGRPDDEILGWRARVRWIARRHLIPRHPVPPWLRLAVGFRVTTSPGSVLPAAFADTHPRGDRCVPLAPGSVSTLSDALGRRP